MLNFGQPSSASSHQALQYINRPFPTMRGDRFHVTKTCCLTLSFTKHVAIPFCTSMSAYSLLPAFSDAFISILLEHVDQWNSVEPLAGFCIKC